MFRGNNLLFRGGVCCLSPCAPQPTAAAVQAYTRLGSFEEDWAAGRVAGWEDRGEGPAGGGAGAVIDLEAFEAVEELETLGAPRRRSGSLQSECASLRPEAPRLGMAAVGRGRAQRAWMAEGSLVCGCTCTAFLQAPDAAPSHTHSLEYHASLTLLLII